MIDISKLHKERDSLVQAMIESGAKNIKTNTKQFNDILVAWVKRGEIAEEEIGRERVKQNMWRDEKNHAIKRWSDIAKENEKLKAKLAKYESNDVMIVPKNTKTVAYIERMVEQQVEASGIDEPIHRLDGWTILDAIEESLSETGEIE